MSRLTGGEHLSPPTGPIPADTVSQVLCSVGGEVGVIAGIGILGGSEEGVSRSDLAVLFRDKQGFDPLWLPSESTVDSAVHRLEGGQLVSSTRSPATRSPAIFRTTYHPMSASPSNELAVLGALADYGRQPNTIPLGAILSAGKVALRANPDAVAQQYGILELLVHQQPHGVPMTYDQLNDSLGACAPAEGYIGLVPVLQRLSRIGLLQVRYTGWPSSTAALASDCRSGASLLVHTMDDLKTNTEAARAGFELARLTIRSYGTIRQLIAKANELVALAAGGWSLATKILTHLAIEGQADRDALGEALLSRSLNTHLDSLIAEGLVVIAGDYYQLAPEQGAPDG